MHIARLFWRGQVDVKRRGTHPDASGRGTHECKGHADPLYRPWTDGVAERLTYPSRATRKPMCPVEVSGAVPVRAALRYLRQYDSWHR